MPTLSQNINQAIADFNDIRTALINKQVSVPANTPTSQYGAKINSIPVGGGGGPVLNPNSAAALFDSGTIQVGHYVRWQPLGVEARHISQSLTNGSGNYTVVRDAATNNLDWRVFDRLQDQRVRLISAAPTTTKILFLFSFAGYNNGVKLINDVCTSLFGGKGGTVKSISRDDLLPYLVNKNYTAWNPQYGVTNMFPTSKEYPQIFNYENGQMSQQLTGLLTPSEQYGFYTGQATAPVNLYNTHTAFNRTFVVGDWTLPIYHQLIVNPGTGNYLDYWLATRTYTNGAAGHFDITYIAAGQLQNEPLIYTTVSGYERAHAFRPIVTLDLETLIDRTNPAFNGANAANAWRLIQQ